MKRRNTDALSRVVAHDLTAIPELLEELHRSGAPSPTGKGFLLWTGPVTGTGETPVLAAGKTVQAYGVIEPRPNKAGWADPRVEVYIHVVGEGAVSWIEWLSIGYGFDGIPEWLKWLRNQNLLPKPPRKRAPKKANPTCRIVSLADYADIDDDIEIDDVANQADELFRRSEIRPYAYEDPYEACVDPSGRVLGASVLGCPHDADDGRRTCTFSVVVEDDARRQGIARALVRSIMDNHPDDEFALEAQVVNPYMETLLASLGFMRAESQSDQLHMRKNPPFKLLRVYDLREVDFFTGEKMPLGEGEGNQCMRCGRLHAVIWDVEDMATQERYKIGSGCAKRAKRAFGGWEPDQEEVKRLERSARQTAKAAREALIAERKEKDVAELVAKLRALGQPPTPIAGPPRYTSRGGVDWYSPAGEWMCYQFESPPITRERHSCFVGKWWRDHADRLMGLDRPPPNRDATKREQAEWNWRREVASEAAGRLVKEWWDAHPQRNPRRP